MRADSQQKLKSYVRAEEHPNPECPVCQDNSQHIAIVNIKTLSEFTLQQFVDQVLVQKLGFTKENGIMITLGNGILAEIDADLSEDEEEILQKRLSRSLQVLKVQSLSILEVLGKLKDGDEDSNMSIQIVVDPNLTQPWEAKILKVGVPNPKPISQAEAPDNQNGQMDLSSDDVEIAEPQVQSAP